MQILQSCDHNIPETPEIGYKPGLENLKIKDDVDVPKIPDHDSSMMYDVIPPRGSRLAGASPAVGQPGRFGGLWLRTYQLPSQSMPGVRVDFRYQVLKNSFACFRNSSGC